MLLWLQEKVMCILAICSEGGMSANQRSEWISSTERSHATMLQIDEKFGTNHGIERSLYVSAEQDYTTQRANNQPTANNQLTRAQLQGTNPSSSE